MSGYPGQKLYASCLICCFRQGVAGMSLDLGSGRPGLEELYARELWADFSFPKSCVESSTESPRECSRRCIECPQMWVWPQVPVGGTSQAALSPSIGGTTREGEGGEEKGSSSGMGGREGPLKGSWGQTHIWWGLSNVHEMVWWEFSWSSCWHMFCASAM